MSTKSNVVSIFKNKGPSPKVPNAVSGSLIKLEPEADSTWEYTTHTKPKAIEVIIQKETIWDQYVSIGKLPFMVRHNTSRAIYVVEGINSHIKGFIVIPVADLAYGVYEAIPDTTSGKTTYIPFDSVNFHHCY